MSKIQSDVLKSLANKMYKEEVKAYDQGETEDKPQPLKKEIKETKKDQKEMKKKKVDENVKNMVQAFFKTEKPQKASFVTKITPQKQRLRKQVESQAPQQIKKTKKTPPPKKKVII